MCFALSVHEVLFATDTTPSVVKEGVLSHVAIDFVGTIYCAREAKCEDVAVVTCVTSD